jgi:hypothetical protein
MDPDVAAAAATSRLERCTSHAVFASSLPRSSHFILHLSLLSSANSSAIIDCGRKSPNILITKLQNRLRDCFLRDDWLSQTRCLETTASLMSSQEQKLYLVPLLLSFLFSVDCAELYLCHPDLPRRHSVCSFACVND